jgi:uncharacterized protein involved in exopolysaccharide biosynthesis
MDQLAKKVAEMALRLAAVPSGRQPEPADLDALVQLAREVLKQASAARMNDSYAVGELTGCWRAYDPSRTQ